jgi:hypothetical protein
VYEWLTLYLANLNSGGIRSSCSDSRVGGSLDSMTGTESFKDKASGSPTHTSLPFKRLMHDADQHLVKRTKRDGTLAIAACVAAACSPRSLTDDAYGLAAPSHGTIVCAPYSHKFVMDSPIHAHGPPPYYSVMPTAGRSYSKRCFLAAPMPVPAFLSDNCRSTFRGNEGRYARVCVACSAHSYPSLPSHAATQREYAVYDV